ncbi:variable surface protein Vir24g [Plasmodium vivax North Korean]|uniref:Variable surface protein Vir24g n=1 Tax=Plasmodium vivax North Korean TaxID=1035514 RepID=A0A0J9TUC7_PLAVI|nr:variable surface protein Vir24g [Plasmodium vivax North Korean]
MGNWDNILVDLPSHKIYAAFDENVENGNDYDKYCSELKSIKFGYDWINDFCPKFVRNLKYINKMDGSIGKFRCLHLNYWVYDYIKKRIKNKVENIYTIPVFAKLYQIGERVNKESPKNYHCSCYFYGDLDIWNAEKELHDYFRNCSAIRKKIRTYNDKCQIYSYYLNHIYSLYIEEEFDCCIWVHPDCHKYFICDIRCKPNEVLKTLRCNLNKPNEDSEVIAYEEYEDDIDSEKFSLENSIIIKHGKCTNTTDGKGRPLGYKCEFRKSKEATEGPSSAVTSDGRVRVAESAYVVDMVSNKVITEVKVDPKKDDARENTDNHDHPGELKVADESTLFGEIPAVVRGAYSYSGELPSPSGNEENPIRRLRTIPKEVRETKTMKELFEVLGIDEETGLKLLEDSYNPGISEFLKSMWKDDYLRIVLLSGLFIGGLIVLLFLYKVNIHVYNKNILRWIGIMRAWKKCMNMIEVMNTWTRGTVVFIYPTRLYEVAKCTFIIGHETFRGAIQKRND